MTRNVSHLPKPLHPPEHSPAQAVSSVMHQKTHIRVARTHIPSHCRHIHPSAMTLHPLQHSEHPSHRAITQIRPAWLQHRTDEFHTLLDVLHIHLVGMESQPHLLAKITPCQPIELQYFFLLRKHHHHIVHETHMATATFIAPPERPSIQAAQVEVSQYLRSDVADSHTVHREQALVAGQPVPQRQVTLADAVILRSVPYGDFTQVQQRILVIPVIVRQDKLTQHTPQQALVNRHKERAQVKLTYPGIPSVSIRHSLHPVLQELHRPQRAVTLPAIKRHVTTLNEQLFQQRLDAQGYPMLHDSVQEMRCEYLPQLRVLHHETLRHQWLVGAVLHSQSQIHQHLLTDAELRTMPTRLLVPATIVCRLYPSLQFFFPKC